MKTAIVNLSDILAQPGAPLTADYWANRRPEETYEQYRRCSRAASHIGAARRHLAGANRSLELAAELLGEEVATP